MNENLYENRTKRSQHIPITYVCFLRKSKFNRLKRTGDKIAYSLS